MKKVLTMTLLLLATIAAAAQGGPRQKAPDDMVIIDEQPEGRVKIYNRSGYVINDKEEKGLETSEQTGTLTVVYGDDGAVYFEDPASGYTYNRWVKGTISADGTTITLPVGQYIDYIRSFDMAIALGVFTYDEAENYFVLDETVTEVTYTVDGDNIRLEGTDEHHILGTVYRPFRDFMSFDGKWQGTGDYASVYTPYGDQLVQLPEGAEVTDWTLTTSMFEGVDWENFTTDVHLAEVGQDVYLQGITTYTPQGWLKGRREGLTVTFPAGQFLGTYNGAPFYALGAKIVNGSLTKSDIVFEDDGKGTLSTSDYIFITTEKNDLVYVVYYLGTTISHDVDELISVPDDLQTSVYTLRYQYHPQGSNTLTDGVKFVKVGIDGDDLYIRGLWSETPDGWAKGTISGDRLTLQLPQYLGTYDNGYDLVYPFYLIAFNAQTGKLLPEATFHYDAATGTFDGASAALGISINKTSFLAVQEYYTPRFEAYADVAATPAAPVVTEVGGDDEESSYICVNIPPFDADGSLLDPEKLGYQLYTDIETDIQPVVLKADVYERLTEDMTVVPYLFIDNDEEGYDIVYVDEQTRKVFLHMDPGQLNRLGVQSVYTGGGEEHRSDIVWHTLKDYSGIQSFEASSETATAAVYDLQGRRLTVAPAKGIYIRKGRKVVK